MDSRVKVKICGLVRKQDIDFVNKTAPDYAGFVFAESRRQVKPDEVKRMVCDLAPGIQTVGVFVNAPRELVVETVRECRLDIIQLHGSELNAYWEGFTAPVWKALPIRSRQDLEQVKGLRNIAGLLLDSSSGGSGTAFDWSLVQDLHFPFPVILAGGLNPGNVVRAIKQVKPFAVDVSSGVETDGVKDFLKIKQFIEKVREPDEHSG